MSTNIDWEAVPKGRRKLKVKDVSISTVVKSSPEILDDDPFFGGCRCYIMHNGEFDNQFCKQHKHLHGVDPLPANHDSTGCFCNICNEYRRVLK